MRIDYESLLMPVTEGPPRRPAAPQAAPQATKTPLEQISGLVTLFPLPGTKLYTTREAAEIIRDNPIGLIVDSRDYNSRPLTGGAVFVIRVNEIILTQEQYAAYREDAKKHGIPLPD